MNGFHLPHLSRARVVLIGGLIASAGAMAQNNSLNLAIATAPPIGDLRKGTVTMLEYEHMVSPGWTIFARGSSLSYKWDEGDYVEEGDGKAIGAGFRYYFNRRLEGMYVGGALSRFDTDWTYNEYSYAGKGNSKTIQWGAEAGYRFRLGNNFSLTPALNIGQWAGGSGGCTYTEPSSLRGRACDQESSLGFYSAVSVGLNFMF